MTRRDHSDHSEPTQVTPERLRELLDAYGAEPARWPEAEREAALALLARDADAARMQREAAELDLLLSVDATAQLEVSPALRARVAEIPIRHPQPANASAGARSTGLFGAGALGLRHAFAMLAGAAFVLGLGVMAGGASAAAEESAALVEAEQSLEPIASAVEAAPQPDTRADATLQDDGWDALLASAFATDLVQEP